MKNLPTDTAPNIRSSTADPAGQHDELFFGLTSQMLATNSLDERLLLALEGIRSGFRCPRVAVALIEPETQILKMRMALGFPDNSEVEQLEMPLDLAAAYVAVVHESRPVWIGPHDGPSVVSFLERLHYEGDLLAIPMFGARSLDRGRGEIVRKASPGEQYWAPRVTCLGVLYLILEEGGRDPATVALLTRLADRIGFMLGAALQMDRMRRTIQSLRRERQWVESIMKSAADPMILTNLDNEILLQNRRAEELFSGWENANEGKRQALKINDLLFSAYLSSAAVSTREIAGRDLTLVDPVEGNELHFEVVSTPALNVDGERIGLVSVFRNVTDLREANEELARNYMKLQQAEAEARRERDRLDLIIENVGQPVVVCDPNGNFLLFNRRAELLFKHEEYFIPEGVGAVRANSVKLTSFLSGLASETRTGRQGEIELIDPNTGQILPMEITSAEVPDAKGQVTAVVSVLHNLSEIRELERRRVEQQLFESEKLAAIGRLAASIAHEVNNPLEAIKNALFLLQTARQEDDNKQFLNIALKETERVSHIIRQMLGFACCSGDVEWINLNQILDETLVLLDKKLRQSNIRVSRDLEPQLPLVRARPDQLRQVFLNLFLNAQQAIDRDGTIRLRSFTYRASLQPSVAIQISDTGSGITQEDLTRIFEPFYSTRKRGTGLGLWVTHDIVRHHGGRIDVTSEISRGSTFLVILPVDSPALDQGNTKADDERSTD